MVKEAFAANPGKLPVRTKPDQVWTSLCRNHAYIDSVMVQLVSLQELEPMLD